MEAQSVGAPVGVTYAGIVQHCVARSAANLDPSWIGLDIQALFTDRLHRIVEVINDADAAGLAEGAGKDVTGTVLVIALGTGIGSAFVFDGKLVPNPELGYLQIGGFDAETKASAVARERNNLNWVQYSALLQRYFSHVEFLFSPDLFIVGGGISACADEYCGGAEFEAWRSGPGHASMTSRTRMASRAEAREVPLVSPSARSPAGCSPTLICPRETGGPRSCKLPLPNREPTGSLWAH